MTNEEFSNLKAEFNKSGFNIIQEYSVEYYDNNMQLMWKRKGMDEAYLGRLFTHIKLHGIDYAPHYPGAENNETSK